MEQQQGKKIFGGIAIGRILIYSQNRMRAECRMISDVGQEIVRYEEAKEKAVAQLMALYHRLLEESGEAQAQIFEMHAMMLEDVGYNQSVKNLITVNHINAEAAVASTAEHFCAMFENMEDAYFRTRSADIKDISDRVIAILKGCLFDCDIGNEPAIIVANDLSPSETVTMDRKNVLAFVTKDSSMHSHAAILARNMGIPALTGIDFKEAWSGKIAIVDGHNEKIFIDPDEKTLEKYKKQQRREWEQSEELSALRGKETITTSGQKVHLCANIGSMAEYKLAIENDAEGIGLFRSEFLFLERESYPTEEEQFFVYKRMAEYMNGKRVIIRTLDIGADKQAEYFQLEKEENPALGCRGIRVCLMKNDIFKTQLRALFRASYYGNIAIMYPMISSMEEIREIKRITEEVCLELELEKIPYGNVKQGIMTETPAAAVLSDFFAKEVDFFSIGTNDLTQYTLAVDRQNSKLESYYSTHSEAVMRLIELVAENAHKAGIWVGICGELAADKELISRFLEMKIDELSVAPAHILPMRKAIREMQV